MHYPLPRQLVVPTLGPCGVRSPVTGSTQELVKEEQRVLLSSSVEELQRILEHGAEPPSFEAAGPRDEIFFRPQETTCGIVTCGGLSPGLNDVIRSLVLTLHYAYGVTRVFGFRYGYAGLSAQSPAEPIELSPVVVEDVHHQGGTLLGSSRGAQDVGEMVDTLVRRNVNLLFTIGGDGTLRGASALADEIANRKLPIGVVGIPKTIDNDLEWTSTSFGFATAVEEARRAIVAAHGEARGAWNGIGLVKLMGRHSGFIAAHASLANADVNFCLVPEVPFALDGKGGFLEALERRLEEKQHAVVVVAEGAGQGLLHDAAPRRRDPSGNVRLGDVGIFLRDRIREHFADRGDEVTVKYIDPSYMIRSLPANSVDSERCLVLGQHAVHAGMAGRTNMMVGLWNGRFTHVPIAAAVRRRKQLDPGGETWHRVLEATGQPARMMEMPLR